MSFLGDIEHELERLGESGRFRQLRRISPLPGGRALLDGETLRNFSGNDYMGISCDPELRREFYAQFPDASSPELAQSSASSRLLTGNTPAYERLERSLSGLYSNRAALVFNSGYHANIGILPALAESSDLVLSDKLNHASIIDGLKLGDAEFKRYRHLDYGQLEEMLKSRRASFRRVFIVTESVFSMDGDCADIAKLVELKRNYDAVLVVDEAHSVGVRGPEGKGLSAELGVDSEVDLLIGTFGKAFGSTGAYAIMEEKVKSFLVNRMRPLIFTTGLPPVVLNWSDFVLRRCRGMDDRRAKVMRMGKRLRELFTASGVPTSGDTQIVPFLIGSDADALKQAARFREAGFLVFAIRPPTVPPNTSRLRFSLSAALDEGDVEAVGRLL